MSMRVHYIVALCLAGVVATADEGQLTEVKQLPRQVSEPLARVLDPTGYQVHKDGAAVCTVWIARDLPVKSDFQPTLNIKYPFIQGQFVGVLEVHQKSGYTDFRGQEVPAGVYTLRYALQPVDGNHVGTSDLYDFLLAIPIQQDTDPAPMTSFETLVKLSAGTVGATHPAIFALLPAADVKQPAVLEHDKTRELWQLSLTGKSGDKPLRLKLVVVGKSEG